MTKTVGEGVKFERIRRITGYLVGTTDRFNNGKQAEEKDRVKHSTMNYVDLTEEAKQEFTTAGIKDKTGTL